MDEFVLRGIRVTYRSQVTAIRLMALRALVTSADSDHESILTVRSVGSDRSQFSAIKISGYSAARGETPGCSEG